MTELGDHNFYLSDIGKINRDITTYYTLQFNLQYCDPSKSALQLGLGDGFLAQELSKHYNTLTVVEGSIDLVNEFRGNFSQNLKLECSYFEEYKATSCYDIILANHILEHVDKPVSVLNKFKEWLAPNGIALITVPNSDSLHRRIGVEMGLLKTRNELNNQDKVVGHKRVYNISELKRDIENADLEIIKITGYNIKLVSQFQMKDWKRELLDAIYKISLDLPPDICSNIAVVCKLK